MILEGLSKKFVGKLDANINLLCMDAWEGFGKEFGGDNGGKLLVKDPMQRNARCCFSTFGTP